MIMSLQTKNRLKLTIPQPHSNREKVLKTCIRCRQHKTKCNAFKTNPLPCTQCSKKDLNCTLEIIKKPTGRTKSLDIIENLNNDVQDMKKTLDRYIDKKNDIINLLITRGKSLQSQINQENQLFNPVSNQKPNRERRQNEKSKCLRSKTPPVAEIQSCINTSTPEDIVVPNDFNSINESIDEDQDNCYKISSNFKIEPIILSHSTIQSLLKNYESNFNQYLPIFPDEFFNQQDLQSLYQENDLLFWSIMTTSLLNQESSFDLYKKLSEHLKSLIVCKLWLQTPRSVYVISSLLILTTWPLPNYNTKIEDNLSVRFISIMKSLSLQFGLHKLEFINEFSHKTKIDIVENQQQAINNLIRERIYKFVNINSNYWLINLGLSNNNYNGFTQDYIINKSTNIDIYSNTSTIDKFINVLLKISMIQSKLNENMNVLIGENNLESFGSLPNQTNTSKLINFNMFEIILNDLNDQITQDKNDYLKNLIKISILYSKLQLFIYSMSKSDINSNEYKQYIYKLMNCCFEIINITVNELECRFANLPIYFKFPIELTSLVLLRIYKSTILDNKSDYIEVKSKFTSIYNFIFNNQDWKFLNSGLHKVIEKFNQLENNFIESKMINEDDAPSIFLINKMKNYLVASLNYEMIWLIFENEKLSNETDPKVKASQSIF